ncbi:MAG: putative nicotinate-nucleotide adenylyltransferase [candidate division TM6 bacterium GW2011_GWF2_28_16]|nr:MAG: putative nicotinate-nucleotide adenylyltransferase [candidate division TM6 bacterium GW2011_GWF2_28_16]
MKKLIFYLTIFCLLILNFKTSRTIVLENLITENILEKSLSNNKIGYYLGSFDPIHKGHENVIQNILDQKLCDYVLVYPAWGGDNFKNRTDVKIRLKMLFAIFENHKHVIVTKLKPLKLQENLINLKTEYIGIIGSDLALYGAKDEKTREEFMSGKKITKDFKKHTYGCIIALPVKSFIVAIRSGDNIKNLDNKIGTRNILAIVETNFPDISSTIIRNFVKEDKNLDIYINNKIIEVINNYNLYKN